MKDNTIMAEGLDDVLKCCLCNANFGLSLQTRKSPKINF